MSTSFFISAIDPSVWDSVQDDNGNPISDLKIDAELYESELLKKWCFAKIIRNTSEHYVLWWTLDLENSPGPEGGLQADFQTVSFKYHKVFVEFVLWHRELISPSYPLYLFNDSSFPFHLVLTPETTTQEVEQYLANS